MSFVSSQCWLCTASQDILAYIKANGELPYPILEDSDRTLATKLGMVDPEEKNEGMPITCRAVRSKTILLCTTI